MTLTLEQITGNISGKVRRETLYGKKYLVAPLSLIVPGVLEGSRGALYYPEDEIAAGADGWNNMPIVLDHPKVNGQPVSARDPKILDKYGLGFVFAATFNGKLSAEGWFDEEQVKKVDSRVLNAIQSSKQMEVSTGLFTKDEPATAGATFNGKSYTATARNHKPDHLAILPDAVGACSVRDGCGLNVNEEDKLSIWKKLGEFLGITPKEPVDNAEEFDGDGEVQELTNNVIHKLKSGKYRLMSHSGKNLGTFDSEEAAKKHEREVEYFKHKNNTQGDPLKLTENERKTLVDSIITNCECWKEEDRKTLNELDDRALSGLGKGIEDDKKVKDLEPVANAVKDGLKVNEEVTYVFNAETKKLELKKTEGVKDPVTNNNNPSKQLTAEQWFETAPPEIQSVVRNAVDFERSEKTRLIDQLVENISDDSVKKTQRERLEKRSLEDLRQDLALVGNTQQTSRNPFSPNYSGASPAFNVRRGEEVDADDILVPPTINWKEQSESRGKVKHTA